MSEATAEDAALKLDLLKMDVQLRYRQLWWEHPRNAAIIIGVIVTATAAIAGVLGYKIGQTPPNPIVIQLMQPPAGH